MKPQRSLVTVLFTDIVGSTELATELGDRAWHALLERHHACVRGELHRFGGHEVATAGDGFLALFDEPGQAMVCAWAVRDAVREVGVEIRCGVHMGAVDRAEGKVGGIGIHIAARVLGEADAGEILVSQTVHDAEAGSGFVFMDRGSHHLKGVSGEWRLFAVEGVPDPAPTTPLGAWSKSIQDRRGVLVGALAIVLLFILVGLYARPGDEVAVSDGQSSLETSATTYRQFTFTGEATQPDVSPDGRTIAYVTPTEDGYGLYVQDLSGGEPLEIGRYDRVWRVRWSPKGENLLVGIAQQSQDGNRQYRMLLLPKLGGSSRSFPAMGVFDWSPDDRRIVFVAGSKRLGFQEISTGDTTSIALTDSFTSLIDVDWSLKDDRIAYLTRDDPSGQFAIWATSATGNGARKVVEDTLELSSPRWTPTGGALYYLRSWGQTKDLVRVDVPSTVERFGTPRVVLSGVNIGDFALFDDGKRILYARQESFSNLWLTIPRPSRDPDVRHLTSGTANKASFSVSPDGRHIALSVGFPHSNIYILPIDGGAMQQLTYLEGINTSPAWSPDGSKIAFGSTHGGKTRVWTVAVDGGTARPYEDTEVSLSPHAMAWAPGQLILYQRPGARNFHLLDPETGAQQPLVSNERGWMFQPRYSPDGTKVAFNWSREGKTGLLVISLADRKQILVGEGNLWPAGWSPDGEWAYAEGPTLNPLQIMRYSILERPPEVVTSLECGGRGVISVHMTPDAKRFICLGDEWRSDLWIAENVNLAERVDR